MYTAVSYAFIFAIGGVLYWYYNGQPRFWEKYISSSSAAESSAGSKSKNRKTKRSTPGNERADDQVDGFSSASVTGKEEKESRKRKINTQPQAAPKLNGVLSSGSERRDESSNNKAALAEGLSRAPNGVSLAPPAQPSKGKKGSKPATPSRSPNLSASGSPTTGADADDDRSLGSSPVLTPAASTDPMADMLEKTTSGPATIRITGEAPAKKPQKAPKAQQPVETAKQRQNRRKNEERARKVKESEEEWRKRQEAQRRGARMAEGSSNEQRADNFAKSAQANAWTKPLTQENAPVTESATQWQPLDTYDAPVNGNGTNGASSSATTGTAPSVSGSDDAASWVETRLSEEEQLRQMHQQEADNSWNTVSSKKKKGAVNTPGAEKSSSMANAGQAPATAPRPGFTAANSYGLLHNEAE